MFKIKLFQNDMLYGNEFSLTVYKWDTLYHHKMYI